MTDSLPTIEATRRMVPPAFFAVAQIDEAKVEALAAHLLRGGSIPPVVAVDVDGQFMPLDGHHRFAASARLGRPVDAWIVDNDAFEDADCDARMYGVRAEDLIRCGGVGLWEVAA